MYYKAVFMIPQQSTKIKDMHVYTKQTFLREVKGILEYSSGMRWGENLRNLANLFPKSWVRVGGWEGESRGEK